MTRRATGQQMLSGTSEKTFGLILCFMSFRSVADATELHCLLRLAPLAEMCIQLFLCVF